METQAYISRTDEEILAAVRILGQPSWPPAIYEQLCKIVDRKHYVTNIYNQLTKLRDKGLLVQSETEKNPIHGIPSRPLYWITGYGVQCLDDLVARHRALYPEADDE